MILGNLTSPPTIYVRRHFVDIMCGYDRVVAFFHWSDGTTETIAVFQNVETAREYLGLEFPGVPVLSGSYAEGTD